MLINPTIRNRTHNFRRAYHPSLYNIINSKDISYVSQRVKNKLSVEYVPLYFVILNICKASKLYCCIEI
jgi:hypothetical protein